MNYRNFLKHLCKLFGFVIVVLDEENSGGNFQEILHFIVISKNLIFSSSYNLTLQFAKLFPNQLFEYFGERLGK